MPATKAPRKLGILLAHGVIHLPSCFDPAKARLEAAGFSPVIAVRHPSIGSDPTVTADDDARNIQAELAPHLDRGREFLVVGHSYGGTPVTIAAKDYSVAERAAQGKQGGIGAVVFVAAVVPPKRGVGPMTMLPEGLDIASFADGLVTGRPPAREAFYGPDVSDELADKYVAMWQPQSQLAVVGPSSLGTEDLTVPAYYVLCEKDLCIPPEMQEEIISTIPTLKRVLRISGGHCAIITEVDQFVEQIIDIADEVERDSKS